MLFVCVSVALCFSVSVQRMANLKDLFASYVSFLHNYAALTEVRWYRYSYFVFLP
jgi:hypothetical protein